MKKYILILLLATLAACNPTKRLDRLITRHPELLRTDTAYVEHTVIIPGQSAETVYNTRTATDTVTLERERLKIQLIKLPGQKIFVKGECKPDTVRIQVPVIRKTYVDKQLSWRDQVWSARWYIVAIVFLWSAVVYFYRQAIKK